MWVFDDDKEEEKDELKAINLRATKNFFFISLNQSKWMEIETIGWFNISTEKKRLERDKITLSVDIRCQMVWSNFYYFTFLFSFRSALILAMMPGSHSLLICHINLRFLFVRVQRQTSINFIITRVFWTRFQMTYIDDQVELILWYFLCTQQQQQRASKWNFLF